MNNPCVNKPLALPISQRHTWILLCRFLVRPSLLQQCEHFIRKRLIFFMFGYRDALYCMWAHPTCNANHSPLCWIQDLPWGWLGASDSLVLGQVPGQGVSRTGGTTLLSIALLQWGSIPASVFTCSHHLPSGEIKRQSLTLIVRMRRHADVTRTHAIATNRTEGLQIN